MSDSSFYIVDRPLDAIPAHGQMRAANLEGFSSLVRNLGGDPRSLLERNGLDPLAARDPDHYIDCTALVELLESCSAQFNDPLFGLHLARAQGPDVFGCVAALCRAAPSLREALQSLIEYIPVTHAPVTTLELVEGKDIAELRWGARMNLGFNSQANFQAALLELKLLQQLGGESFRPSYVALAVDARPGDLAAIEAALGCPFRNRASANAIAFPTAALGRPVGSSNRLLYRLLGGYLDRVKASAHTSVVDRVRDYIHGALPSGSCAIEHCARKLGTSVRTLQTDLAEFGLRFSDMLEEQRFALAKHYLDQPQMTLDEVAARLGYSEQSSFGRAFKRWGGITPQQFRSGRHAAPRIN